MLVLLDTSALWEARFRAIVTLLIHTVRVSGGADAKMSIRIMLTSEASGCNGNNANVHQGYGQEYGQAALTFIKSKLSSGNTGGTTTTTTRTGGTTTTTTNGGSSPTGGSCSPKFGQCGGQGWTGPTCCQAGSTCNNYGQYYSQCL